MQNLPDSIISNISVPISESTSIIDDKFGLQLTSHKVNHPSIRATIVTRAKSLKNRCEKVTKYIDVLKSKHDSNLDGQLEFQVITGIMEEIYDLVNCISSKRIMKSLDSTSYNANLSNECIISLSKLVKSNSIDLFSKRSVVRLNKNDTKQKLSKTSNFRIDSKLNEIRYLEKHWNCKFETAKIKYHKVKFHSAKETNLVSLLPEICKVNIFYKSIKCLELNIKDQIHRKSLYPILALKSDDDNLGKYYKNNIYELYDCLKCVDNFIKSITGI